MVSDSTCPPYWSMRRFHLVEECMGLQMRRMLREEMDSFAGSDPFAMCASGHELKCFHIRIPPGAPPLDEDGTPATINLQEWDEITVRVPAGCTSELGTLGFGTLGFPSSSTDGTGAPFQLVVHSFIPADERTRRHGVLWCW